MSAPPDLDLLLSTQLIVAYAGETSPDAPRLGWWDTDICSPDGGLDVLRRLYPRTWRWAALHATRAAARAFDAAQRKRAAAAPDHLTTLFHFGFTLDEQLDDHLDHLAAAHPDDPLAALPALAPFVDFAGRPFDRPAFEAWLGTPIKTDLTAIGRRVPSAPSAASPSALVTALRAALLPLPATYPLPYAQP